MVALHRSVKCIDTGNVSSMRPSPSNPESIQHFKPLFLQPPGPIIRQCWEGSDTRTNATLLVHAQLLSHLQQNIQEASCTQVAVLQRQNFWIQVCVLSSDTGFKLGLTWLTDFPLCRDPNTTTAMPGSTTYKQRIQVSEKLRSAQHGPGWLSRWSLIYIYS